MDLNSVLIEGKVMEAGAGSPFILDDTDSIYKDRIPTVYFEIEHVRTFNYDRVARSEAFVFQIEARGYLAAEAREKLTVGQTVKLAGFLMQANKSIRIVAQTIEYSFPVPAQNGHGMKRGATASSSVADAKGGSMDSKVRLIRTVARQRKIDRRMSSGRLDNELAQEWWKLQRRAAILEAIVGLEA